MAATRPGQDSRRVSGHLYSGPDQVDVNTLFLTDTGTKVGSTYTLVSGGHHLTVTIAGEVFQPGNQPDMFLSAATLHELDPAAGPSQYGVSLKPGTDAQAYANTLSAALGSSLAVTVNTGGTHLVAVITLVTMLTIVIIVVAGLGVLNTVALQIRERAHAIGVFKAVGMTPRQTLVMIICSVAVTGLVAGVVAVPAGVALHHGVVPVMASAANSGIPPSLLSVYPPSEFILLALAGLLIAVAGALARPAGLPAPAPPSHSAPNNGPGGAARPARNPAAQGDTTSAPGARGSVRARFEVDSATRFFAQIGTAREPSRPGRAPPQSAVGASGGRIGVGLEIQETFVGHPGILCEAAHRGVAGQFHQHRCRRAVLGRVGQSRVPQLVQGTGAIVVVVGVGLEQLGGAAVGQSAALGRWIDVGLRHRRAGLAVGEEHRPGLAAGQQPRQQPGGAGLPRDQIPGPALAGHHRTPVRGVQLHHVEHQHFLRPCRGLVQHVPQHPFPQRRIRSQDLGDPILGQRLAGVRRRGLGPQPHQRITDQPRLFAPVLARRPERRQPDVELVAALLPHTKVNHPPTRSGS